MSRISGFSSPFLLGFEEIERLVDRVTRSAGDAYPPYNIERIRKTADNPDMIRITLAVAGFDEDDLEITLEENQLIIEGSQSDDGEREFIHRGIAARRFRRSFVLAEGLEIEGAELKNGLLSINLVQPAPQRKVQKIRIENLEREQGG